MSDTLHNASSHITDVAVGLIEREDSQILLGQRPQGKPWAGWWELPGGKLEPGETAAQALTRELKEELGIEVTHARPWVTRIHHYPTTTVRLAFYRVTGWRGDPTGLENQALRWIKPDEALRTEHLLPATYPPLKWLTFPSLYAITHLSARNPHPTDSEIHHYLTRIDHALSKGLKLLQWREPNWSHELTRHKQTFEAVLTLCHQAGARLLVNSVHPASWWHQADGVHLRQADAQALQSRPPLPSTHWVGLSAHNEIELEQARQIDVDFVTLSPVLPTASHPGTQTMGWTQFADLQSKAGVPVYALGGLSPTDLAQAWTYGAQGVAGIERFLK